MEFLRECFIEPEQSVDKDAFKPASYLRRVFHVDGDIERAELHITACGLYSAVINGEAVTDEVFTPGFTYYRERLQVQVYDVTSQLRTGANVIGVILGDGWWRGSIGLQSYRNFYGEKTSVAARLKIRLVDGSELTVSTDQHWKATQNGPIRKSDWKDGETYDARRELIGWQAADYDDSNWHEPMPSSYDGELAPGEGEAIREKERLRPAVLLTPDGATVLDFRQNIFGYVEFKVSGSAGHRVVLTHGEVLDENGNLTLKNLILDVPALGKLPPLLQEIHCTLKDGEQRYKPRFSAQGFRYVKVENWPQDVLPENFSAIAVYSDMDELGFFHCSHDGINKLVENTKWSQKGNFVDVPTDCPTRERAGWTGDIASFCEAGSYLMNTDDFLSKWMKDLALQQHADGCISNIVPDMGMDPRLEGSAGWADAAIIVPYTLYKMYGNRQILADQYECMKRFVGFMEARASDTHPRNPWQDIPQRDLIIETGYHWGEWLEPGFVPGGVLQKNFQHPDAEVATAYYGYSTGLLAEIARLLDKEADADRYQALADSIKAAYRYTFTDDGLVRSPRQCHYVRPVALGPLSEADSRRTISALNELVVANDYCIGTGFLSTPFILNVLTDYGFAETAYKMAENEKRPGWLYQVSKGATTIWESWDGIDDNGVPQQSHNHYAFGAVTRWFFAYVAGITPLQPGFQRIRIKPFPGGSLTHADCTYQSAAGPIRSAWRRDGAKFSLDINVPTATEVHLPDGAAHQVSAGSQRFTCQLH